MIIKALILAPTSRPLIRSRHSGSHFKAACLKCCLQLVWLSGNRHKSKNKHPVSYHVDLCFAANSIINKRVALSVKKNCKNKAYACIID